MCRWIAYRAPPSSSRSFSTTEHSLIDQSRHAASVSIPPTETVSESDGMTLAANPCRLP